MSRTITRAVYRAPFPDVRKTVDDVIASGNKVALRWHSDGTHHGELAGLAPTGVHGSGTAISIDHGQHGKIVEAWAEWDNNSAYLPPEGSIGRSASASSASWLAGCAGSNRSKTSANVCWPGFGDGARRAILEELRWLLRSPIPTSGDDATSQGQLRAKRGSPRQPEGRWLAADPRRPRPGLRSGHRSR